MTTQQSLSQVWAETGGVTDPGTVKYEAGWIAEIPTYQNFNYVLQTTTKNILSLAEKGALEWDTLVDYDAGSKVKEAGTQYFALAASTGQQPSLDVTHTYWSLLPTLGDAPTIADQSKGMHLANTQFDSNDLLWDGNALTITDYKPVIALSGTAKNWLIANSSSQLVAVDTDAVVVPDSRSIAPGQAGVHRLFHEGHPPVQSEVDDTIPTEPQDGKLYARRNGSWVESTTTAISIAPPPPVSGVGHGWYNLDDGQFYLDINDGDSSQWIPANPPAVLDYDTRYAPIIGSAEYLNETQADALYAPKNDIAPVCLATIFVTATGTDAAVKASLRGNGIASVSYNSTGLLEFVMSEDFPGTGTQADLDQIFVTKDLTTPGTTQVNGITGVTGIDTFQMELFNSTDNTPVDCLYTKLQVWHMPNF